MNSVVLYTTPACGACKLTKNRFDRLGISYQMVEAGDTEIRELKQQGFASFPVVKVDCGDGSSWSWSGFRNDDIVRLSQLFKAG